MEKKEFKVGEVFDAGLVRLKCVEPRRQMQDVKDVYLITLHAGQWVWLQVRVITRRGRITRMLFLLKLIRHVHQFQTACSIRHDS